MNEDFKINTDDECSIGELALHFRQPKKYILSKTIPVYQKDSEMNFFQERMRKKNQSPQYFTNILKQQKKNMFVNTFLRKLRSTVIMKKPPERIFLNEQNKRVEQDEMQLQVPKIVQLLMLIIWSINSFFLLILNSMALIFDQIDDKNIFQNFMILSFLLQCLEVGSKFVCHLNYQQNKLIKINQITNRYLKGDFCQDAIVLFALLMQIALNSYEQAEMVFRIITFLKVRSLVGMVQHLQITLIENQYRQQIWSLVKVFLFNFIFAHILTLALLLMARIKQDDNWLLIKNLQSSSWSQKYIWGYYWATTIMLTVGFGDITPQNSSQALCMIFIETMSCIVLAYNINRLGTIIQKILSYEDEKNSHLKTFNQIKQKSQFSNETKTRIMNYIKESTQIRRNFNLGEEKQFIESLPSSFKSDMLKQMNRHIWNGMMFFQNLSQATLVKLSITIQKKLAHPEQILYSRGHDLDIMVFNGGGFGYSYNNGNSMNNGLIMQHFDVQPNKYQIVALDFLFNNKLKYDIKCTDYSVVYKISKQKLVKILNNHSYDSEYFFMINDKDKFLTNEYEIAECQLCKKERHSVFKCPKLHFIPLRQHVIRKYKDKHYPKIFGFTTDRASMKKYQTLMHVKSNIQNIQSTRQFILNYLLSFKSDIKIESQSFSSDLNTEKQIVVERNELQQMNKTVQKQNSALSFKNIGTTRFYEEAIHEIRSKIDHMMHPTVFSWDLEVDVAFNYKFYFRKHNSDQIINHLNKMTRKNKNKIPKFKKVIKSVGYRKVNKL